MKIVIATLVSLLATSAYASPQRVFLLTCGTKATTVSITVVASSDGLVQVNEVVASGSNGRQQPVTQFITDVEEKNRAPQKVSFYHTGQLVELKLSQDAITSALEKKAAATVSVDGAVTSVQCTGSETF